MTERYYLLVTFLVNVCSKPLRELFVSFTKAHVTGNLYTTLDAYLVYRKPDVMKLKQKKVLRQDQLDLIYPANGQADVETWDITLLSLLLQHLFPNRVNPVLQDILAIRKIRNDLQHISGTANVTETDFKNIWQRLERATLALANSAKRKTYENEIEQEILKTSRGHIKKIGDVLREWYSSHIVELNDTVATLKKQLEEVHACTSDTKTILQKASRKRKREDGTCRKWMNSEPPLEMMRDSFEKTKTKLLHNYQCGSPNEVDAILKKLDEENFVVVCGFRQSMYLQATLSAINKNYETNNCVEMKTPSDWHHIDAGEASLLLFIDPFDKCKDELSARELLKMLDSLKESMKEDNTTDIVLVTDQSSFSTFTAHYGHELLENPIRIFEETSESAPCVIESELVALWEQESDHHYRSLIVQSVCYFRENNLKYTNEESLQTAREMLRSQKVVVISGPRECGKTTLALTLLQPYQEGHYMVLTDPDQLDYVRFGFTCVILIEDLGGKYMYDRLVAQKWLQKFDVLYAAVKQGKINVIITCDTHRLSTILTEISSHSMLENVLTLRKEGAVKIKQELGTHTDSTTKSGKRSLGRISFTEASRGKVQDIEDIEDTEDIEDITSICQYTDGSFFILCDVYYNVCWYLKHLDSNLQETYTYRGEEDDQYALNARDICCTQTGDLVVLCNKEIRRYKVGDRLSLLSTVSLDSYGVCLSVHENRIAVINPEFYVTFYDNNLKFKGTATLPTVSDDFRMCVLQKQLVFLSENFIVRIDSQKRQTMYIPLDEHFSPLCMCSCDEESVLVLGQQTVTRHREDERVEMHQTNRIFQVDKDLNVVSDITCTGVTNIRPYLGLQRMVYDRMKQRLIITCSSEITEIYLK